MILLFGILPFLISHLIKGGNVNPRNFCRVMEEFFSGEAFCLVLLIKVHQMEIFGLTFANIKNIKEISL